MKELTLSSDLSSDLGDFKFVVDKEYLGDKMLSVIDRHFPDAVFSPDETIRFSFKGAKYLMRTEKINYTGPAYYRIRSISITASKPPSGPAIPSSSSGTY